MKKLFSFGVIAVSIVALTACSSNNSSTTGGTQSSSTQSTSTSSSNIPAEYQTAVTKAKQYEDTTHLSKEGLRTQLIDFEKYSQEATDYAIDNAGIDYNQQALEKAKSYQETMAMSPEAIRDQLTSYENSLKKKQTML